MDSGDVVASIKLASNPDSPSAYSSYTSSFESVEAPDANTVVIKTERPNPLMLFDVAQLYVLKQEIAEVGTEEQVAHQAGGFRSHISGRRKWPGRFRPSGGGNCWPEPLPYSPEP